MATDWWIDGQESGGGAAFVGIGPAESPIPTTFALIEKGENIEGESKGSERFVWPEIDLAKHSDKVGKSEKIF